MPTKQEVISVHLDHPDWSAQRIAKELNCSVEQIFAVKQRNGLKIPRAMGRMEKPNNVFALGREARRAGLTVDEIQRIGALRRSA